MWQKHVKRAAVMMAVAALSGLEVQAQPGPFGGRGRGDDGRAAKARELIGLAQQAMGATRGPIENYALEDIAITQTEFGDIQGAMRSIAQINDASDRLRAFVSVAGVLRNKGDIPGAKNTMAAAAREIGRGRGRMVHTPWGQQVEDPRDLRELGVGYARIGDVRESMRIARSMAPSWEKAEVLARTGEWFVARGDAQEARRCFAEAKATMRFVNNPLPPFGYGDIAYLELAANWVEDARATALSQLNRLAAAGTFATLAMREVQTRSPNAQLFLKDARQTYTEAPMREDTMAQRALVAAEIAKAHAAAGEPREARRMIGEAMRAAEGTPITEDYHATALVDVSIAAQRAGDDGVSRAAWERAMNDLPYLMAADRVRNLWVIAVKKAWAGDAAGARALAMDAIRSGMIDPMVTALQARGIAGGMVRTQGPGADLSWVAALLDRRQQAAAYAAAAAELSTHKNP
jgi:hypothetical protein